MSFLKSLVRWFTWKFWTSTDHTKQEVSTDLARQEVKPVWLSSCCLSPVLFVQNWFGCFDIRCLKCKKEPMEIYDATKKYNKEIIDMIRQRISNSKDGRWM